MRPSLREHQPKLSPSEEEAARPQRRRDLMAGSRPKPIVPKSLSEVYRIAQAVCAAKMAPKGLDTPEACMIAIMHGLEVGLSPLAALQRIAVINGRPTIWGDGALALVKASGLCEAIDEWIEGEHPEDWVAVCNVIRRGDPVPVERRFSSEDAKRAKLWGKNGPWSDYPKRMLQMRARAFALRDAFPDVLGGLYLTEEIQADSISNGNVSGNDNGDVSLLEESGSVPNLAPKPQAWSASSRMSGHFMAGESHDPEPSSHSLHESSKTKPPADKEDGEPHSGTLETMIGPTNNPASYGCSSDPTEQVPIDEPLPIVEHMPALANLRRARRMPRGSLALRFRNEWSVRQPKKPASSHQDARDQNRRPTSEPTDMPNQKRLSTSHPDFVPEGDIAACLELYDAALCCASDGDSLLEIAEEFTDRLTQLPRQSRQKADLIFERHAARIATASSPNPSAS